MYEQFFGLRERPFDLTPDPRSLVLTQSRYEAVDCIAHSIAAQETVTLVLGEAGSGKSTIIRAALAHQPVRVQCLHLQHPRLMQPELVQILVACFGLSAWAARSKRKLRSELERVLIERRSRGEMTALFIDEAQRLAPDVLEEIRLLASMETKSGKLMTVVIAGQPELAVRLDTSRLR